MWKYIDLYNCDKMTGPLAAFAVKKYKGHRRIPANISDVDDALNRIRARVRVRDDRLDLPEGSRFRAVIRPESADPAAATKAMETIRRIRESGAFRSGGRKLTRDEMHERH